MLFLPLEMLLIVLHLMAVHAASLDIRKAFCKASHYRLFMCLVRAGLPKCIIDVLVIGTVPGKLSSAVKWNTCISRWFTVNSGVRQCGVLAPALSNIFPNLFIDEFRASGFGFYLFDMFAGCFMYADNIILLSGSLNDLQSMLNVGLCFNVSSQLLLKFNADKCKCVACGKMACGKLA